MPNAHYYLHVYGATTTAGQFTLDATHIPNGEAAYVDVRGGNAGNIFGLDGAFIP